MDENYEHYPKEILIAALFIAGLALAIIVFSPPNESVAETAPVEAPAHNDPNGQTVYGQLDLLFPSHQAAKEFGRQWLKVRIVEEHSSKGSDNGAEPSRK